jgi:hypothetical protein
MQLFDCNLFAILVGDLARVKRIERFFEFLYGWYTIKLL